MNILHSPYRRGLVGLLGLLSITVALSSTALEAKTLQGPVVSVQQLQGLLQAKRVTVLDTRELLQTDQKTPNFVAGHIPGALPLPYSSFRGPKEAPGAVLPIAQLEALLAPLGIGPADAVVLAGSGSDATEFGGVARIYWTLKAAGFKDLAVLDGGLGAWMAAKLPLETGEAKARKPLALAGTLRYNDRMVLSTKQAQALSAQPAGQRPVFVDARPEDFFLGQMRHASAARWGTIAQAKWLDSEEWFVPNTGRLLGKDKLSAVAKREGVLQQPTVQFCNTGHWAATNWFILSEVLGQANTLMYAESVVGWSQAGLPMDNEPSRATALLWQAKGTGIQR
ncbi:MAG: sulfurtransferase [Burkholderiaceae bacterium]